MEQVSAKYEDYSLFFKFFVTHAQTDFKGIKPDDPILAELNSYMEQNNQFFYIADAIYFKVKFVSSGVYKMFGIEQENVSPGFFITTTHPDDYKRHHLARTKMLSTAQEFFNQKSGTKILSTNLRGKKINEDVYHNLLYQIFAFYYKVPVESTYMILVFTDISGFKNIHNGFHYYFGNDPKLFRFPNEKLLSTGIIYSYTEFRILELINEGLSTNEIADKLFRSKFTISTHRNNILLKSGKKSTNEVIHDLKLNGLL